MENSKPLNESENAFIYDQNAIMTSISVLKQLGRKTCEESMKKQSLLEETSQNTVFLQMTLKKFPVCYQMQMFQIGLPHSLITDTTEVCLITGDLDKPVRNTELEPIVLHFKELLQKNNITQVNEVVPLQQLRTEYKTSESKRHLAAAYDVFLADKKIVKWLPKLLGKEFYKSNKFPLQVDMNSRNLKSQIEKALLKTSFLLKGRGTVCSLKVARMDMDDEEIAQNVKECVKVLSSQVPGTWKNIGGLYLKTAKSKAIPFYLSFANPTEVDVRRKRPEKEKVKWEELSTIEDLKVRVFRSGRIEVKKTVDDFQKKGVGDTVKKTVKGEVRPASLQKSRRRRSRKSGSRENKTRGKNTPELNKDLESEADCPPRNEVDSLANPNEVKRTRPKKEKVKREELSTLEDAKVKVSRSGKIQMKQTKKQLKTKCNRDEVKKMKKRGTNPPELSEDLEFEVDSPPRKKMKANNRTKAKK